VITLLPRRGERWKPKMPEGFDLLDLIGRDSPFHGFIRCCPDFMVKIITEGSGVVSLRNPDGGGCYRLETELFMRFFTRYS
jgi:hypothetical protein